MKTLWWLSVFMLIDGKWVESVSGARIDVENPANRQKIAEVPRGGAADVEAAVAAAVVSISGSCVDVGRRLPAFCADEL